MGREKPNVPVENTSIKLTGKDNTLKELVALLMAPNESEKGLNGPKAEGIANKLLEQNSSLEHIDLVQQKKGFKHPSEAAKWLLEADNKLIVHLWEQDTKGGPVNRY